MAEIRARAAEKASYLDATEPAPSRERFAAAVTKLDADESHHSPRSPEAQVPPAPSPCAHENTIRGPDLPLRWGSRGRQGVGMNPSLGGR